MAWVPIFDTADSWPDPAAMWARGFRVFAAYAGSQAWKAVSAQRLAQWRQPAHPYGTAPMFESAGDEPINAPSSGTAHARAARAAWRRLGCPDTAAIAYAVDRNVTLSEIKGNVAKYFELVGGADTTLPIAYLENDGVAWLHERGLIAGGFIPAAYSWGNPPTLMTPANAPSWVLWTQEHNGVDEDGASVDIGHIRDTAPIWWPRATPSTPEGNVPVTEASIWGYKTPDNETAIGAVQDSRIYAKGALAQAQANNALLAGIVKSEAAIQATLAAITAGGTSIDTAVLAAQIKAIGDQESADMAKALAANAALSAQIAELQAELAKAAQGAAAAFPPE